MMWGSPAQWGLERTAWGAPGCDSGAVVVAGIAFQSVHLWGGLIPCLVI